MGGDSGKALSEWPTNAIEIEYGDFSFHQPVKQRGGKVDPLTDEERIQDFRDRLSDEGLTTTIRASRGEDIFAACGLLSTKAQELERPSA